MLLCLDLLPALSETRPRLSSSVCDSLPRSVLQHESIGAQAKIPVVFVVLMDVEDTLKWK